MTINHASKILCTFFTGVRDCVLDLGTSYVSTTKQSKCQCQTHWHDWHNNSMSLQPVNYFTKSYKPPFSNCSNSNF